MGKSALTNRVFGETVAQTTVFQFQVARPLVVRRHSANFTFTWIDTPPASSRAAANEEASAVATIAASGSLVCKGQLSVRLCWQCRQRRAPHVGLTRVPCLYQPDLLPLPLTLELRAALHSLICFARCHLPPQTSVRSSSCRPACPVHAAIFPPNN